jgi:hypothetical protein
MVRKIILVLLCIHLVTSLNAKKKWGKYTLIAPQSAYAYLIDTSSTSTSTYYHKWTFTTGSTGYSAYLLPGGTLIRTVQNTSNAMGNSGGMTGKVEKVDWSGNVTWTFTYSSSTYCLHHDICPLPNGNILMISYDVKTSSDAATAGCSTTMSNGIWSEKIIEVQPSGTSGYTIVWEWHLWDHLCQSAYSAKNNYVSSVSAHPELMNINYATQQDWWHMNGLDYNPYLDQISISAHNMNEIYVIDHSTNTTQAAAHTGGNSGKGGDFLYRWGNTAAYGVSGTADFNVVHNAHWVAPYCPYGNYLGAFNNKGGTSSKSCIDYINPPYDGYTYTFSGTTYTPATYDWRYTYTGNAAQDQGSSQVLPNGNVLICAGTAGYVLEIDSTRSKVLWSMSTSCAKALRYSECYVAGTQPSTPTISQSGNILTCSGDGTTYMWFYNGNMISGATAKTYTATSIGNYQVQVYSGSDCFSTLSDKFAVTSLTSAVKTIQKEQISFFPNPATDNIHVVIPLSETAWDVNLYDLEGEKVLSTTNKTDILVSTLLNGIYILKVNGKTHQLLNAKVIINHQYK